MTKQEKVTHKNIGRGEILNLHGQLLPTGNREPDIHQGEGAILMDLSGNVKHELWRLRAGSISEYNPAIDGDLIPWCLSPNVSIPPLLLSPDQIFIGTEDEDHLITSDPETSGDMNNLKLENINGPETEIDPELLINAIEIKRIGGMQGFNAILRHIQSSRARLLDTAIQSGQHALFLGAQPTALLPDIHPHPYLQKAGLTTAKQYLQLDPESHTHQTYFFPLIGQDWATETDQQYMRGLSQFSGLGFQTNINIPVDNENLAVEVGNKLAFSDISIILAGILNSSPVLNGVLSARSDTRLIAKRVLASANPQAEFYPLKDVLERVNEEVVSGKVPTIARALCLGVDGGSVFHGMGMRIRGDRGQGNSTWEDMLPSTGDDEIQAAYAYIKACQTSYLIYCQSHAIEPDRDEFNIQPSDYRESLINDISMYGPKPYTRRIFSHLNFLENFFDQNAIPIEGFEDAKLVFRRALQTPTNYCIENYYQRGHYDHKIGLLTDHLRATVNQEIQSIGENPNHWIDKYNPQIALAVHSAMMRYAVSLARYYSQPPV